MKKLKKLNEKTLQSVVAFACPCAGTCGTCVVCGCATGTSSLSADGFQGNKVSISSAEQYGYQTPNYL